MAESASRTRQPRRTVVCRRRTSSLTVIPAAERCSTGPACCCQVEAWGVHGAWLAAVGQPVQLRSRLPRRQLPFRWHPRRHPSWSEGAAVVPSCSTVITPAAVLTPSASQARWRRRCHQGASSFGPGHSQASQRQRNCQQQATSAMAQMHLTTSDNSQRCWRALPVVQLSSRRRTRRWTGTLQRSSRCC